MKALIRVLRTLSPSCREATRLQSEALDHPLGGAQRWGLKIHLFLCKWCRRYRAQLQLLRLAARHQCEHSEQVALPVLSADARQRLEQMIQSHSRRD